MPDDWKHRTLVYRRAEWFTATPRGWTFQEALKRIINAFPHVDENRISEPNGWTMEIRHYRAKASGVHLHVAGYTAGEYASIVPKAEDVAQADLSITPPPAGSEFMDGDLMLMSAGDDVILCPSGLSEGRAIAYVRRLLEHAGYSDQATNFELLLTADVGKFKVIQQQGVKSIRLDVGLYAETVEETEHRTVQRTLRGSIVESLLALLEQDLPEEEIRAAENLKARLILSFDSRKAGAVFAGEQLGHLANHLVRDEDEGFVIVTNGGEKISQTEIAMRKPVKLQAFAKTVSYLDAWTEINKYFTELGEMGALEQ